MTQIVCRASTCLFWGDGVCNAEEIEYEPDVGCLSFQDMGDLELEEDEGEELDWEGGSRGSLFADDDDDDWDEVDWDDDLDL